MREEQAEITWHSWQSIRFPSVFKGRGETEIKRIFFRYRSSSGKRVRHSRIAFVSVHFEVIIKKNLTKKVRKEREAAICLPQILFQFLEDTRRNFDNTILNVVHDFCSKQIDLNAQNCRVITQRFTVTRALCCERI